MFCLVLWGKQKSPNKYWKSARNLLFCWWLVTRLSHHYEIVEEKFTPATFLLLWFPSSVKKSKEKAARNLHTMLAKYVELRRNATMPSSDVIDESIAGGCNNESVIAVGDSCRFTSYLIEDTLLGSLLRASMYVISLLFPTNIPDGTLLAIACSSWVLLFLTAHTEWKEKFTKEINSLILILEIYQLFFWTSAQRSLYHPDHCMGGRDVHLG